MATTIGHAVRLLALLLPALALAGCGFGGAAYAPTAQKGAATVSMALTSFQPAEVKVHVGDTVLWRNSSLVTHTVTADPARAQKPGDAALPGGAQAFDSGDIAAGQIFSHTFATPGTYRYFCMHHESLGMVATVVVQP